MPSERDVREFLQREAWGLRKESLCRGFCFTVILVLSIVGCGSDTKTETVQTDSNTITDKLYMLNTQRVFDFQFMMFYVDNTFRSHYWRWWLHTIWRGRVYWFGQKIQNQTIHYMMSSVGFCFSCRKKIILKRKHTHSIDCIPVGTYTDLQIDLNTTHITAYNNHERKCSLCLHYNNYS